MSIPIYVVLFNSSIQPSKRKQLLLYDSQGIPIFDAKRTIPELSLFMIIYEIITWMIPILWITYFVIAYMNIDVKLCEDIRKLQEYKNNTQIL
jgi:hypothetical protein